MVDYIKIYIDNVNLNRLLQLSILDFKKEVSTSTGEIGNVNIAIYHYCKIKVYDNGKVYFSGSLHKLNNSLKGIKSPNYSQSKKPYKGFNGNQFTIDDVFFAIKHLMELFNSSASEVHIVNMEYGLNLKIPFDPQLFIKGLLYYNNKRFEYRYQGYYCQIEFDKYILKIYNKSNQYSLDKHTLRIEVKTKKSCELKKMGIFTFEDINEITLQEAYISLLKHFDKILYYDYTIRKNELKAIDKQKLSSYSNPSFFLEMEPKKRDKPKKKLNEIIKNHSDNLKKKIRQEFIRNRVIIHHNTYSLLSVISHTSSIWGSINYTLSKRCLETKEDISMQKLCSKYLSYSGLRYIYKVAPEHFEELKRTYLPKWHWILDIEEQINIMAKLIRTRGSDKNKKQKKLYPSCQLRCFDIDLYLV